MQKRITAVLLTLLLLFVAGCGAPTGKGDQAAAQKSLDLADGNYQVSVALSGGSGRASVTSPAQIRVKNGKAVATIVWSSSSYDYMIVNEVRYEPVTVKEHSVFEIPIDGLDTDMPVTADTVAMSAPHEIDYTLRFDSATLAPVANDEAS